MSRRLSVAHRPGAVGGRGGLPPAGLAAPHRAERGALINNRANRQRWHGRAWPDVVYQLMAQTRARQSSAGSQGVAPVGLPSTDMWADGSCGRLALNRVQHSPKNLLGKPDPCAIHRAI